MEIDSMANTLGIPEVTLVQAATSTNAVNQGQWDKKRVIRITDHASDDNAETSDPEKMAIFECKALGHPWMRVGTHLNNTRHVGSAGIPADVEVLYPDWDYNEFE